MDPKDKITNADEADIVTNSGLENLQDEIKGSDADYIKDSPQKDETLKDDQVEDPDVDEEIDPKDNPEK